MKNVTAFALLFAVSCLLLAGCQKEKAAPKQPAPSTSIDPGVAAAKLIRWAIEGRPPKCSDVIDALAEGEVDISANGEDREIRDICEITYTSLKDIAIDGNKALEKRAKFTCRFEIINNGQVLCGSGVHQTRVNFGDKLKPLVRKLRRGKRLTVDMAITKMGPLGPEGHAFNIKLGK